MQAPCAWEMWRLRFREERAPENRPQQPRWRCAAHPRFAKILPRLPKTEAAVNEILSLPIYGDLPMEDVDYVCDAVLEFFGKK